LTMTGTESTENDYCLPMCRFTDITHPESNMISYREFFSANDSVVRCVKGLLYFSLLSTS
jgi:hypothetical protein